MKQILAAICFLALASSTFAAEVSGIKVDDKATLDGQNLVLNGASMRTRLFAEVYVGALRAQLRGRPAWPAMAMDAGHRLRLKPQNLPPNLPLARVS